MNLLSSKLHPVDYTPLRKIIIVFMHCKILTGVSVSMHRCINNCCVTSDRLKVGRGVAERDIVQFVPFRQFATVCEQFTQDHIMYASICGVCSIEILKTMHLLIGTCVQSMWPEHPYQKE